MLIIKAKSKTLEEMPDREKCCKATIDEMLPWLDKEITLIYDKINIHQFCCRCGKDFGVQPAYRVYNHPYAFPIDTVHLDEGSVVYV